MAFSIASVRYSLGFLLVLVACTSGPPTPSPSPVALLPTGLPHALSAKDGTCPRYDGRYSDLDSSLWVLAYKYDQCELSEEEAAARARFHFGGAVLVEIDAYMGIEGKYRESMDGIKA